MLTATIMELGFMETEINTKVKKLEIRVQRMSAEIKAIKSRIAMLPQLVNPLTWENFDDTDRKILEILLNSEDNYVRASEISAKLALNRVKVWRHLKRIVRISKKQKGIPMVIYDPSLKAWSMNRDEYEFQT